MGIRRLVLAAAVLAMSSMMLDLPARAALGTRVSGNLVFWDQARGIDAIVANADVFSEISPFWYRVLADGRVAPYTTATGASYVDASLLSFLRARGILVIPTVANIVDGVWDGAAVRAIVADPQLRAANIANLVSLAVNNGYDGIDLDYEDLTAADRAAYTSFVRDLAAALHGAGKLLTVNVYAKTEEPGSWDGPRAQDWQAIGEAADQVRIMTYEYSWSTSAPGPIAPVSWVDDVIGFARTQIPAAKIVQGVPLYGYDWVGQRGTDIVWTQAMSLASQYAAAIRWDAASASPWFDYLAGSTRHTVWFENAASVDAKLAVAAAHDIGGVTLWRLGGEDPGAWPALRTRLGGAPPAPDATPPAIAITSPADGAVVAGPKKLLIEAQASDNVRVDRVTFFVNGALLASDSSAPYSAWWNTQRANRGANSIEAVAYDSSGNRASARVTVYGRR